MSQTTHRKSARARRLALSRPLRGALAACAAVLGAVAAAPRALCDEVQIRRVNPDTAEPVTEKIAEVTDENWVEVSYRAAERAPIKKIPTRLVIDVRRITDDPQAASFQGAMEDLLGGRFADAALAFQNVGGGGPRMDDNGRPVFRPFGGGEASGPGEKAGKPRWYTEYAHFWYAYAAWKDGVAKGGATVAEGKTILENALRALDADKPKSRNGDVEVPAEKGFLVRFREGKSRYYADALLLRANLLADLGRHDDADAAFDALYQKSLQAPIGVRWSYEAKVGTGRVAALKGIATEAESRYESAAAAVESLFATAPDQATRVELGRFYNEARMRKAQVMLEAAERDKSPAAYARMRDFLVGGTPDALRKRFSGKPPEVVDAVVAGAMSPTVQAVAQNGIGLAFLAEKKHVDALFAFAAVRIKYFQVAQEVPRALYYLAQAADAAGDAAPKAEAKAAYKALAAATRDELKKSYKDWHP